MDKQIGKILEWGAEPNVQYHTLVLGNIINKPKIL